MKKPSWIILLLSLLVSVPVLAQSFDSALNASTSGLVAQKIRLSIIAENVANVSTLIVEETGKPYRAKYGVLEAYKGGVRVKSIGESKIPVLDYPDSTPPQSQKTNGYGEFSNVSLPEEMINMSYTEVMYEANVSCFKTTKNLYQSTIDMLK